MAKKLFLSVCILSVVILAARPKTSSAQANQPEFRVTVNMVQLNIAVTDNKGNYVTGLRPENFAITEDGTPQKIATFGEGDSPARKVLDVSVAGNAADPPPALIKEQPAVLVKDEPAELPDNGPVSSLDSALAGSNVFVLFDTSNYMYRGFVFAQDAIADFVRSLESVNRVSFYSYSRDLSRSAALTSNRSDILRAVRTTVAGDDAALYNCLLLP